MRPRRGWFRRGNAPSLRSCRRPQRPASRSAGRLANRRLVGVPIHICGRPGDAVYEWQWLPLQELLTDKRLEALVWLGLVLRGDDRATQESIHQAQQERLRQLPDETAIEQWIVDLHHQARRAQPVVAAPASLIVSGVVGDGGSVERQHAGPAVPAHDRNGDNQRQSSEAVPVIDEAVAGPGPTATAEVVTGVGTQRRGGGRRPVGSVLLPAVWGVTRGCHTVRRSCVVRERIFTGSHDHRDCVPPGRTRSPVSAGTTGAVSGVVMPLVQLSRHSMRERAAQSWDQRLHCLLPFVVATCRLAGVGEGQYGARRGRGV